MERGKGKEVQQELRRAVHEDGACGLCLADHSFPGLRLRNLARNRQPKAVHSFCPFCRKTRPGMVECMACGRRALLVPHAAQIRSTRGRPWTDVVCGTDPGGREKALHTSHDHSK